MCTYNITVDEDALQKLHPSFNRESFGRWLQHHVDSLVEDMIADQHSDSPLCRTEEEMKAIVKERLRQLDEDDATLLSGEQVFAQMRARYGFNG